MVIKMSDNVYDLAIIGGGVSGLTAAIYSGRYQVKTTVFTDSFGGLASGADVIVNYPGFLKVGGVELLTKITDQVKALNIPINYDKVIDIFKKDDTSFVINTTGEAIKAKKVLLAIGMRNRKLTIPREDELTGKGVHYCTTCDAAFYKDKITAVVGGSDAAVTSALLLADSATKVYIIYRKDKLRAEPMWLDSLKEHDNIEVIYNAEVKELIGEQRLEKIKLSTDQELDINGLFIEIGTVPDKEFLSKLNIELNEFGEIVVDKAQKTSIPGIYASGDATNATDLKQIITAEAQGSIAAYNIHKELKSNK